MTSEEWLGIVHWLETQDVRWTVDIAAKYGVKLRKFDADKVRQAMVCMLANRVEITAERVVSEMRRKPSKWQARIESSHRQQYPRGCGQVCEVCGIVDNRPELSHNA